MKTYIYAIGLLALVVLPFSGLPEYLLHIAILILLRAILSTAWAYMGRFGLVSLGHGGFMGVAVYATALLWNLYSVPPWLGIPVGIGLAMVLGVAIGYPAFRFRVVGHYFALVTLALGEVVRLSIIAARDVTGGSLGLTVARIQPPTQVSWYALQFAEKYYFYLIALLLWVATIYMWHRIDRSMARFALEAISEDEVAAASVGIHVTREKLRVTLISATFTGLGGVVLGLYLQYLNPESLSGIGISLEIVFAAIVGGMYSPLGPTIGATLTLIFREGLRVYYGVELIGMAETIYGLMLILFIVFMPRGIYGSAQDWLTRRKAPPASGAQPGTAI